MSAVVEGPTASPAEPHPSSGDGRLIAGRFRLLEPLGRGGMGRVYRARDELLARSVAVKLIYDDSIIDSDVRHACALEARAAARLNHPGIVRILDSGFDDGHLYVVMSLAEGRTLSEIVRTDGPLPTVRALEIAMQVADALGAAHQEGIVHCDVKPSNLIVRPDGTVQLVDFGIARIATSTTSMDSSTLQGSAEYVAPEQVEGSDVDGRTDLYALGVVLYETLTGRTPFGGGTIASVLARRLVNDPPPLREVVPQAPAAVERVVRRMLACKPADRFQTAAQLHTALAEARVAAQAALLPQPPAAPLTDTMPFPLDEGRSAGFSMNRARAWSGRQRAHFGMASERALVATAGMALAALQFGRLLAERALPVGAQLLAAVRLFSMRLLLAARHPSLASGVGIAIVVGLLIGTAAARCNIVGASTEAVLTPDVPVAAAPEQKAQPTATPVKPVAIAEPPATVAPTAVPPAPTAQMLAEPEPTAAPEPTQPVVPPIQAVQPPVQAAPSQAAPPQVQAPGQAKKPDDPKPESSRQPKAPAPKPVARPMSNPGSSTNGNQKQDDKQRGNNGNGQQKKR